MKILYKKLDECPEAVGAVVVIDVIRAFTTACFAFAAGARQIILVSEVSEALRLRQEIPGALAIGEVGGVKVAEFDYGNSPSEFLALDLSGASLVQRTSSGTQGAVRAEGASILLAASFVCAGATAAYLRRLAPGTITFIITGITADGKGDEDLALADYLSALLSGSKPEAIPYLERVRNSRNAQTLRGELFRLAQDVELCADLDRFPFALRVERKDGLLVMQRVEVA